MDLIRFLRLDLTPYSLVSNLGLDDETAKRIYNYIHKIDTIIHIILCFCPYCGNHDLSVCVRGTRTAYADEASNYELSCLDCYLMHDEYWQERWDEYYAGLL